MEPYSLADYWRVQEELKYLKAGQQECLETLKHHSARLAQLEARGGGDDKIRSLWGTSSPFPALSASGVFSQPPPLNHHVSNDDFEGFEAERGHDLLSSLPLDEVDVPRRGASRANSVRFDTSTLQTRWGQDIYTPNLQGDFYGHNRSNNNSIGGHPLTERSMSFKSDGRQSSMRSFEGNSMYDEQEQTFYHPPVRPCSTAGHIGEAAVPSIIRCWVDTSFNSNAIVNAAVCTGAARSTIDATLITRFSLESQIREKNGEETIALSVYLPDAVTQHRNKAVETPGHFPRIVTEFLVIPSIKRDTRIHVFLGADILSASHADILFSQRQVVLFVEDGRQMFVPFVQLRNEVVYSDILTGHAVEKEAKKETKDALVETDVEQTAEPVHMQRYESTNSPPSSRGSHPQSPLSVAPFSSALSNGFKPMATAEHENKLAKTQPHTLEWRNVRETLPPPATSASSSDKAATTTGHDENRSRGRPDRPSISTFFGDDEKSSQQPVSANPRSAKEGAGNGGAGSAGIWDSWRKQSISGGQGNSRGKSNSANSTQRGMKVLKTSKSSPLTTKKEMGENANTSSSHSSNQNNVFGNVNGEQQSSQQQNVQQFQTSSSRPLSRVTSSISIGEKLRSQGKPNTSGGSVSGTIGSGHVKARSTNVVGGASAFHWMAAGQKPSTSTA
ncbi:hypothetical protein BJ508DRAFT_63306 [Ascobolus immersus RN42]|uniref:Ubiquitin carboxyl-terminal hydrolase 19 n=1 Tax=Ascobolus immersus RN42 TaxID=1160509 RepID=A0A3N4ISF1_ASCIM|nr:hypothetical protein BJ508DRAFT_63306 [Ascobolus immersus RN42]